MKKWVYIVGSVIIAFLIISGIMLSIQLTNKNIQSNEPIGKVEEIQKESNVQALETEPQVPETWDLNKVTPVLSEDNIYVPVPKGWSISSSEDERYVNGNVTKKGSLSSLTFTSSGDYPWTKNDNNIWVSGNKQQPNSISELISNEIEVGPNGGWVEVEWSVCSSYTDILYMYVNDTINGTSELIREKSGFFYGKDESTLIYTKCGKELTQGRYTISLKYVKDEKDELYLDSGYIKTGTFINYNETGTEELEIHKTGGFVVYEGTQAINNLWTASKTRNQFVWVPVDKPNETIYERNSTTGKIKARLWAFTATQRTPYTGFQTDKDTKAEPGITTGKNDVDRIKNFSKYNLLGYTKDTFYKELETEYKKTIESIEKYGGFYIGRYETGNLSSKIPVVRRMNYNLYGETWYSMYDKLKNMSSNKNIQTSMIWGSLWDQTIGWIVKTGEKENVEIYDAKENWGNFLDNEFKYYNDNGELIKTKNMNKSVLLPSGATERNMANNIYDLYGNVMDRTLQKRTNESTERAGRGGQYINRGYSSTEDSYNGRGSISPETAAFGCRAFFYIQ